MNNLTTTEQIGFSFSDSNHYITANEYGIIMKEIANYLNNLHKTKTITVVYDSDVIGGGFQIIDSRWLSGYKTIIHHFQQFSDRKISVLNNFKYDNEKRLLHTHFYKPTWIGDYTILHYFHYDITLDDKYTTFQLERMTPLQKCRAIISIKAINQKENKKLRHWTFLKARDGSPKWTNDELNVVAYVFNTHGINTSRMPKL